MDKTTFAGSEGERWCEQYFFFVSRKRFSARGNALCVFISRHQSGIGYGNCECRSIRVVWKYPERFIGKSGRCFAESQTGCNGATCWICWDNQGKRKSSGERWCLEKHNCSRTIETFVGKRNCGIYWCGYRRSASEISETFAHYWRSADGWNECGRWFIWCRENVFAAGC